MGNSILSFLLSLKGFFRGAPSVRIPHDKSTGNTSEIYETELCNNCSGIQTECYHLIMSDLKLYKGLPHAFKEAGVLEGICVLIFTGFLSFRGMMLLIKAKQYVSKDNISRIKLTPVNSADEDQVQLLEKVLLYSNSYYFKL